MFSTYAIYYVSMLGFNPLQLLLVGTALEVTIVLFEVPTGVVADTYSRRLSVIIGTFVLGSAYLLEGSIPLLGGALPFFGGVLVAEVIRGVGETFLSGAQEAWIADEVGQERLGALLLRSAKLERGLGLAGIAVSVALSSIQPNLPYMVGGVLLLLLGALLAVAMPETGFQPQPRGERSAGAALTATFRQGLRQVRGSPVLLALMAVTLIGGAASEGLARLWEAHLLITFSLEQISRLGPAAWMGIIHGVGALLGMLVAHFSTKHLDLSQPRTATGALLAVSGWRIACLLAFALAPSFPVALAAFLAMGLGSAIQHPAWQTWTNRHIQSDVRATVLSMLGQADAVGQSGGGPFVGWVGLRSSIRVALVVAALLLMPALAVYRWAFLREKQAA